MAILVPIMVQFMPVKRVPFYTLTGMQLGFPFNSRFRLSDEITFEGEVIDSDLFVARYDDYRSFVDVGFTFGVGYMVVTNLNIDLRFVTNFNRVYNNSSNLSL